MPEYNAGDARLRIVPDASKFKEDLETKLKAMNVEFTVRLNIEMAQAKADMARFRAEENNRNLNQRVNPQFSRAREELAAFRAEQRRLNVDLPVKVDPNGAREGGSRAGTVAREGFLKEFLKLSSQIGSAFGSAFDIAKVMGITSLVASIPGAITAVVSLTQAIEQLGGAALVVPGAIGGMIASIGTLAIGLDGMADAYSAVTAASSGSAANTQAITSAHQSLSHAVQDEAHAQKDVAQARKDARRQLEDLNLELRGGHISEEQAINDAKKARRDLATGRFTDALDYKDAQLRVEASDQRVAESHQRNIELQQDATDKNAKGIEGSDLVVAANERLVRSTEAVANAQAALSVAGGMGKAADEMKKLSPAAAAVIDALVALKPAWTDLQKTVSGNIFEGVAGSLTNFVNDIMPNLKSGLGAIGTAWNSNIKTLMSSLGSDNSKGLLDRLLGNTADAQTKFSKAIDPLVRGIGTLTAAGSDALPRLADAFGRVAERFATFIEAADQDGRLAGWIDKGLTGFTDLGNILLNVFQSFHSIDEALGDATGGKGLLGGLRDVTERMKNWLGSDLGQQKLRNFFIEGKRELDEWKPIVKDLITALPQIWEGAREAAKTFMPLLTTIGDLLRGHPQLIADVVEAFIAWKTIKGVAALADNLTSITSLLKKDIPAAAAIGADGATSKLAKLNTILKKLGLLAAAAGLVDLGMDLMDKDANGNPQTGPASAAGVLATLGGGALAGAQLGPGGAAAGLVAGGVAATFNALDAQSAADEAAAQKLRDDQAAARLLNPPLPATVAPTAPGPGTAVVPPGPTANAPVLPQNPLLIPFAVPGHSAGGPTPSGRGNGPTGGFVSELHGDEWVLPKHARKAIGDRKLWAMTKGRSFEGGGGIDEHGNPLTPGSAPGPADGGAGDPASSGMPSAGEMFGNQLMAGLASALPFGLGNFLPHLGGVPGASFIGKADDGRTTIGGHPIGLDPGILSGNPDSVAAATNYVGKWAANTISSGISQLTGPLLSTFSLENSVLSPDNPYSQGIAKVVDFFGKGGGDYGGGDVGMQTITLPTGETIQVPTSGSSVTPNGLAGVSTGAGAPAPGGDIIGTNPAAAAQLSAAFGDKGGNFDMTPELLASKGIQPLYNWGPGSTQAGNVPPWMQTLAGQFGLTADTYANGETLHQGGYAWDISGPQDKMDAFAQFIQTNLSGQTLQLIHSNPTTGQKWGVAGGQAVGPGTGVPNYYSNDWAGHGNHVHWATNGPVSISLPGLGAMPGTAAPGGANAAAAWGLVPTASYNGGEPATKAAVYQAFKAAGFGPEQWAPLVQLINHESTWNPTAKNPGSTAYGLFQFLDTTWGGVGAARTSDPMAQAVAGLAYIKGRYGTPSAAWNFWQHPTSAPFDQNWYDVGGWLKPGVTMAMNATGQNERILNPEQSRQYEALQANFKTAATPIPKIPLPTVPDARGKQQGPPGGNYDPIPPEALVPGSGIPGPQQRVPGAIYPDAPPPQTTPLPPSDLTPIPHAPPSPSAPENPQSSVQGSAGAAPSSQDHLNPAVSKGIQGAFQAAGNIAQTAAAVGTFGAAGGLGGGAGGGLSIAGAFNQFGKIATGIANVGASFLVGSASNIGGDTGNAYGRTYRPAQTQPATAQGHTTNYNGGITVADPNELRRELDLRDAQYHQSILASHQ